MQASKVLVVDGEPQILGLLKEALGSHGLSILTALNAEQAIHILDTQETEIAVVLSEVQMPGMSGQMLVREIVQRAPTIAVALMSGDAERRTLDPRIPFFSKPFKLRILIEAIEQLMARQKMWTAQAHIRAEMSFQRASAAWPGIAQVRLLPR
jgi:two-component system cell cycle sensor histidine kinase/response regulator CckA